MRHQRTTNRDHLLLAARTESGWSLPALLKAREPRVDTFHIRCERAARRAMREAAGEDVLLHSQVRETPASFQYLHDAAPH